MDTGKNGACTPEVLTCFTLYNHCDYYLALLVIYKRLNILKNDLAFMAMYCYNLHLAFSTQCASTSGVLGSVSV